MFGEAILSDFSLISQPFVKIRPNLTACLQKDCKISPLFVIKFGTIFCIHIFSEEESMYFIKGCKLKSIACCSLLALFSTELSAMDLKSILKNSLVNDPVLQEATANIAVAEAQTKVSKAGHYPVLSVTNTSMIQQRHKEKGDDKKSTPGLRGRVNLYSWGGVEASVERDKNKTQFYRHKYFEARELLGKTIGELYLTALRAKENIAIYRESLQRHKQFLKDVETIAGYDTGRTSEVVEAQSRILQVEAMIADGERTLYTSLSRLSRYTQTKLTPEDLQDPFAKLDPQTIISRYNNPEAVKNPTYQAQSAELRSTEAAVKAAKAKRLPTVDLEGNWNRDGYEIFVGSSWDVYNPAASYTVEQEEFSKAAAEAKLKEIELSVEEQTYTSETDMLQNYRRQSVTSKQIVTQRKVIKNIEEQFKIAYRSLSDVLDSYRQLSDLQIAESSARNDFRDAALAYLASQARISDWAGVITIREDLAPQETQDEVQGQ